ncbi:hypothetical protein BC835DRAFT_367096 [Cytidiella melzeri]|nr:hypothetical protein BC835DRAFT_367096 [Cytidiella melzeri]
MTHFSTTSDALRFDAGDEQQYWENWRKRLSGYVRTFTDGGLAWTTEEFGSVLLYSPVKPVDLEHESGSTGLSQEQQRRLNDWVQTSERIANETLGDSRKDMAYLALLATTPVKQGRGYASALVKMVVEEADAQGRMVWLMSSNIVNTGFYNSHGFVTKVKITVGEDNPTWDRPPVVICLMVRNVGAISTEGHFQRSKIDHQWSRSFLLGMS